MAETTTKTLLGHISLDKKEFAFQVSGRKSAPGGASLNR